MATKSLTDGQSTRKAVVIKMSPCDFPFGWDLVIRVGQHRVEGFSIFREDALHRAYQYVKYAFEQDDAMNMTPEELDKEMDRLFGKSVGETP